MSEPVRGRVIAVEGGRARIRTASADVEVDADRAVVAGDLVEVAADGTIARVRPHAGGDYPVPGSEVTRLDAGRRDRVLARSRAMAALRAFFAERGFAEVDTPLLVPSPGLEVHLAAVPAGEGGWLITSPEYQMKRLLAGGLERIYQVCKCFRAREEGVHHSSEFTMVEWYRAWSGLGAIEDDTQALVAAVARAVHGEPVVHVGGRRIDVGAPWLRMTVAEAMARWAGVDVLGDEPAEDLARKVAAAGHDLGGATAWDDVFFTAFVARVEPAIAALDRPLLLVDWPVRLAALARRRADNPAVVERFEAYIGGIELANAFGELTDPVEQRARFEGDLAVRRSRGLPQYPLDEKLLAALAEGLPPCAGIALGVDRLMMLALGAHHIREVLTFTADEL
jgi:elongation factor P--(R)-beta-lysine ligase